jgi:anti-sigma regulatory factor (Ser/Thr protein kinase)
MMGHSELTFDAVDDLVAAHARSKLARAQAGTAFAPSSVGPLVELSFEASTGRYGPLLESRWLDSVTQADLRSALRGAENVWLDGIRHRGFLRTVFDLSKVRDDPARTQFLMAARKSAEAVGFAAATAQSLAAAIREMESNVHEHSGKAATGIIVFQAQPSDFEFVVADGGAGILATLREAAEFRRLSDHGRALHTALQEGVSRYGRSADHGNGFRDLFRGLADLNADLRFRSGDHALTISGRPDLRQAVLAQKAPFQGFLASVRCRVPAPSDVLH